MRSGRVLYLAVLLALPACSADDDPGGDGTGTGGFYATGGLTGMGGGVPTGGVAGNGGIANTGGVPPNTGGIVGNTGGIGAGGGPDPGSGGIPGSGSVTGSGGDPGSGGVVGSGGGGNGTNAKIPEITGGTCPDFKSGVQTIMGLSTNIVAGAPGAVKGPILFAWHGTGGNGQQALFQLPQSVQQDITRQGGIVIAASDNSTAREGADVTGVLAVWYDVGDIKYADFILGCAVKNNNIDPNKVFVTGCSAGGLMTGVMTMKRSSYVASSAPNSGGLTFAGQAQLQDKAHVPAVFCMNGGSGDNVGINFGESCKTFENAIKGAGGFAVDCNHNSGHCGAPAALHEKAWEFMKAHPFNVGQSPYKAGLPAGFPSYCTII